MAKKPEPIVRLAVQTARQITANSGNYMAFLNTAAHNFKYSFRDQLLIYAQKPDATGYFYAARQSEIQATVAQLTGRISKIAAATKGLLKSYDEKEG